MPRFTIRASTAQLNAWPSRGESRELARFGAHSTRALSQVRLPAGDWVLIAGPLAGTPTNQSIGREVPLLLNLETGEQIELVNLPSSG